MPAPPPPAPPPPPLPTPVDPAVKKARADNRQAAALAGGRQSTVLTTSQGLTDVVADGRKTVLGV